MKYIFLFITALLMNFLVYSQSDSKKISIIKDVFYSTEQSVDSYKKHTFDFKGYSSEGGDLEIYSKDGKTRKAVISYYGEMGKRIKEFYFRNDSLFFVFDVVYNYNQPASMGDFSVVSKLENRYYIWDKGIIKLINSKKEVYWNEEIPDYSQMIETINYESNEILSKK